MRNAATLNIVLALALAGCNGAIIDQDEGSGSDEQLDEGGDDSTTGDDDQPLGPMTEVAFTESQADLLNPERGYYVGYDLRAAGDAARIRTGGNTLAIAIVNLSDYRTRALDATVLTQLQRGFDKVRAGGIKVILRFTYNASLTADASKAIVLQHIDQLAPLLQDNADVISVMQAGFIGAWGEWHSSTNGLETDAARAEILDALLTALPATRGVQVRTPMYKAAYLPGGPVSETEAYTGSARARVGHHNDCFLASPSDLGTYASPVSNWLTYVATDGQYTAVGGETCAVYTARTNCDAATAEMESNHWSFLNEEYKQEVLASWEAQGCDGEIRRRLGYRFALDQVAHTEAVAPGGVLALELDLHNSGFATPFNRRPVELVLTSGSARHVVRLPDVDARRWAPGPNRLAVRLRIPADLAAGTYTLALRLPDEGARLAGDARHAIQLANAGVWDGATGDNVLTRALVIDASAPGPRDPAATSFSALP